MGRGSSGISKGTGISRKLAAALKLVEDRIRGNSTESAVAMDKDGNILFDTSDGKAKEVSLTPHQQLQAYGQTVTHNHPHGYYFSPEDLGVAEQLQLRMMRATTPDGRAFVLERTGEMPNMHGMRLAYAAQARATAREASQNVGWSPSMTDEEFGHLAALEHTKIMNKWLNENAKNYGYTFRVEKGGK